LPTEVEWEFAASGGIESQGFNPDTGKITNDSGSGIRLIQKIYQPKNLLRRGGRAAGYSTRLRIKYLSRYCGCVA
jgi:formylglycine-generating enzyme required for sulfatase activity